MEYECFLRRLADLEEGKEVILTLRDLAPGPRKYHARHARAVVSRSADALANWDRLWVRSVVGVKDPRPWGIRILEEHGDSLPGKPYTDIFEAMAWMQGEGQPEPGNAG